MINLGMFIPDPNDATSKYRGSTPLNLLRKQMRELNPFLLSTINYDISQTLDLAFVQRPALRDQLLCVHMLKEFGVPVWVDYDDDYINESESNPRKGTELEARMTEVVKECLKAADIVTVTNSHLKSVYEPYSKNIRIVPNALCDDLLGLMNPKIEPKNVVLWRGNDKQRRDAHHFRREIMQVYRNNDTKNYNWMFAGYDPELIYDEMVEHDPKRVQKRPGCDFLEYHRQLCEVNWAVMIKPLQDTVFNRSRSNITWIEACLAGSVCIAPNWESWTENSDLNSLITYESPEDFKNKLTHILTNPNEIIERATIGRKYVQNNLLLSKVNLLRKQIIIDLLEGVNCYEQKDRNASGDTTDASHAASH